MGVGTTARKPVGQQTAFIANRITRAGGASQTVTIGILPAGGNILRIYSHTRVIFDGTTPALTIGITGLLAGIAASFTLGAALGWVAPALVASTATSVPDVDTPVLATFTVTGGTVGTADITIEYTCPDATP